MTPEIEAEIERRVAAYRASLEKRAESGELVKSSRPRQDEAKALFNAGLSKRQIAEKMGIGVTMAGIHLANAGCVEKRKPNPSRAEAAKRNESIWQEVAAGGVRKEIAQRYGVSVAHLSSIITTMRWQKGLVRTFETIQAERRQIFEERLSGKSYTVIAKEYPYTRERIRQICEKQERIQTRRSGKPEWDGIWRDALA